MNTGGLIEAAAKGAMAVAFSAAAWRALASQLPPFTRQRCGLTSLVFIMAAPFFPSLWHVAVATPADGGTGPHTVTPLLPAALVAIWLGGTALWLTREIAGFIGLRRLIGESTPWTGEALAFPAPVRLSEQIESPCVAGIFRPILLLPPSARTWDADTWHCVLQHEAHHVREGDLPRRLLCRLVTAVYWWLPPAHWLARQIDLETEASCDAAVVAAGTPVRRYAEVLLRLASAPLSPALPMSDPSRLGERLRRLLQQPAPHRHRWPAVAGLTLVAASAAALSFCGWKSPASGPSQNPAPLPPDTALRLSADPFPADRP